MLETVRGLRVFVASDDWLGGRQPGSTTSPCLESFGRAQGRTDHPESYLIYLTLFFSTYWLRRYDWPLVGLC